MKVFFSFGLIVSSIFDHISLMPLWAADQIRAILTSLVKNGEVVRAGEKTKVYTLK